MPTPIPVPTYGSPATNAPAGSVNVYDPNTGKPLAGAGDTNPNTGGPTIGSFYTPPSSPTVSPDITAAKTAQDTFYQNEANGIPNFDQNAVRQNAIASMQAEIDATNNLYADKLAEAKVTGAGRVGNTVSINARSGEAGSDFGNANINNTNAANNASYSAIQDAQNSAIQGILSKANDVANTQIAAKTTAMQNGLDSHLKYLEDNATRATTNANDAATYIYNSGIDISALTPAQLAQTASGYGVTPDAIKSAFVGVKKAGDATKAATALDTATKNATIAKDNQVSVGNGTAVYTKQPDGTYKLIANNPKTFAPTKPTATTQAEKLGAYGSAFVKGATMADGTPTVDSNGYITPNAFKAAMRDAIGQGLTANAFINAYGSQVYAPNGVPDPAYGLTPAQGKLISGVAPLPSVVTSGQ